MTDNDENAPITTPQPPNSVETTLGERETLHKGTYIKAELLKVVPSQLAKDLVYSLRDESQPWRAYAVAELTLQKYFLSKAQEILASQDSNNNQEKDKKNGND